MHFVFGVCDPYFHLSLAAVCPGIIRNGGRLHRLLLNSSRGVIPGSGGPWREPLPRRSEATASIPPAKPGCRQAANRGHACLCYRRPNAYNGPTLQRNPSLVGSYLFVGQNPLDGHRHIEIDRIALLPVALKRGITFVKLIADLPAVHLQHYGSARLFLETIEIAGNRLAPRPSRNANFETRPAGWLIRIYYHVHPAVPRIAGILHNGHPVALRPCQFQPYCP